MLKRFFLLLCALCLFTTAFASEPDRITDGADLFTEEETEFLTEQIRQFQMSTGMDFILVTSDDEFQEELLPEKADSFYDDGNYGMGRNDSGLLYWIDMYNRIPYISTCGDMIMYMTDSRLEAAHEVAYDSLKAGRYALAVVQLMAAVKAFVYSGVPFGQYTYPVE